MNVASTSALHIDEHDQFLENPYPLFDMGLRVGTPICIDVDNLDDWPEDAREAHEYAATRLRRPGRKVWMVFKQRHCAEASRSAEYYSMERNVVEIDPATHEPLPHVAGMLSSDPPDHTRLRNLVFEAFKARPLERLEPRIRQIAKDLLDNIQDPTNVDMVKEFTHPLPVIVIAELLGVPVEDRAKFMKWSDIAILHIEINGRDGNPLYPLGGPAFPDLTAYLEPMMEARRREPKDDLISMAVQKQKDGYPASSDEILWILLLLLVAGNETTRDLLHNSIISLLKHPDQLEELKKDRSLLPNAVEEVLRYNSPVQFMNRSVAKDTVLGGRELKAGDEVVLFFAAANRDPDIFENPDQFDIHRKNAGKQQTFGVGLHHCLGAPLARLEGVAALDVLLDRFPNFAFKVPANVDRLPRFQAIQHRGVITLPLDLTGGQG